MLFIIAQTRGMLSHLDEGENRSRHVFCILLGLVYEQVKLQIILLLMFQYPAGH